MTFKSKDVTFENSKNIPFQRWYPYIEGYSPDFVKKIITDNVPNAKLIYEPFAGTGTTMFASDILNIPTIYSEVNPLMRFLIESKIDVLSMDAESRHNKAKILRNIASDIFEQLNEFSASDELKESYENVFKKCVYFPEDQYVKVLKLRTLIDNLQDSTIANLVTVACFSCLLPVSFLKKQGDVRYKTAKERLTQMKTLEDILPTKILQIAEDVDNMSYVMNATHTLICPNAKMIGHCKLSNKIDTKKNSYITKKPTKIGKLFT